MSLFPSLDNVKSEDEDITLSKDSNLNIKTNIIEYTYETILDRIEKKTINSPALERDILNNFDKYLDYDNFIDPQRSGIFHKFWTNTFFLNAFLNVVKYIGPKNISIYNKISISNIVYNYINQPDINQIDKDVFNLQMQICDVIHHPNVITMSTFMYTKDALQLCIARYSDFDENKCIHRLEVTILQLGYDFSKSQLEGIFDQLFPSNEAFSDLFRYSMTDRLDAYLKNDKVTAVYNRMNNTLLSILNDKGLETIASILMKYSSYCAITISTDQYKDKLRKCLHSSIIEKDYPNITTVIHRIAEDYYVY